VNLPDLLEGRGGGFEVEIGCGNGHFLCEYAAAKPETAFVGIDIKKRRCLKAREKAAKRGLSNVSIVHGNAEDFLQEIPPLSVDAFHVYFPDPWPKSRHRKRRFFTSETLAIMHERLKEGGKIHFGTDFFDYYIQAKVLVALHEGLQIAEEPFPPQVLSSLFGRKFAEARKPIHSFSARRGASAHQ
jgi:tRNA (guanine-N7-)-methyltransferase